MPISITQRTAFATNPSSLDMVKWAATEAAKDIILGEGSASASYALRARRAISYIDNPDNVAQRLLPVVIGLASENSDLTTLEGITALVKAIWVGMADFEQSQVVV